MKRGIAAFLALSMIAAFVLVGCSPKDSDKPTELKIGLVVPLSGGSAGPGIALQRGVLEAAERLNSQGGVNGMTVKIISEDDESNPVKTVSAVKKLITEDKVVAIIGSNASSCTLAAMEEAARAEIPLVTPSSSSDDITQQGNEWIFRVTASNGTQATALVDYAVETLELSDFAIVHSSDDYGTNALKAVAARLKDKYNIEPLVVEAFQPKDRDFSSQMTKVKNSGAKGLFFLAMYDPVALGSRTLSQMGYQVQIMGLGALTDVKLIELGGDAVLGAINTQMYVPEGKTEEDKAFIQAFQTKYDTLPNYYAALAYDSLMVIADAVRRGESIVPKDIRDELRKTVDFPGIGGNLTFDETGEISRDVMIVKVTGIDPPTREVVWPE